jgi:TonB family protein
MKYITLFLLSLCLSLTTTAQLAIDYERLMPRFDRVSVTIGCTMTKPIIKDRIDSMAIPKYPFCSRLKDAIALPEHELFNCIQGTVLSQFMIDSDGKVTNTSIKYGVHKVLDYHVLSALNAMPAWKPAMSDGKPVPMYFTLPFIFKSMSHGCPSTDDGYYNAALKFYKKGNYEQALDNFKLIVHRNYADIEALWNIAVIYIAQNKPEEACPYLKQILDVRDGKNLDDRDVVGLINKCCPTTD